MLLDVGLNVDCKPEVSVPIRYRSATLYAQGVMHKENPRIALLNIGEEKEKGNQQTKAAYETDGKLPPISISSATSKRNTCFRR